jgi:predicted RNA-binding protein YlxR (DUF448 family)
VPKIDPKSKGRGAMYIDFTDQQAEQLKEKSLFSEKVNG